MTNYFIESFKVTKLWGYRDVDITFYNDVNILIGPNGSGKTTVLYLLHSILSADLPSIVNVKFEQAEIKLRSFKGKSIRTIKVNLANGLLKLKVGQKELKINLDYLSRRRTSQLSLFHSNERKSGFRNFSPEEFDELTSLVPIVWLPVSRRLPIIEDEEERYARRLLESVDLRLEELLNGLSRYHTILNAQLSERYKKFENQVLSMILYSKEHDKFDSISFSLPTEAEKEQLRKAFTDAGLLDEQIQSRINDHFAAVEESIKRIKRIREIGDTISKLDDILVFPLISRTKDMVEFARKLEEDRETIFAPLNLYKDTVNSFLEDKTITVDESGHLKIQSSSQSELNWRSLSSGEKQILILLTQALLELDDPVVYVADEPELSLHVKWQAKLLASLVSLGGKIQVIVATHSPDIVGDYRDKVINLGRKS